MCDGGGGAADVYACTTVSLCVLRWVQKCQDCVSVLLRSVPELADKVSDGRVPPARVCPDVPCLRSLGVQDRRASVMSKRSRCNPMLSESVDGAETGSGTLPPAGADCTTSSPGRTQEASV